MREDLVKRGHAGVKSDRKDGDEEAAARGTTAARSPPAPMAALPFRVQPRLRAANDRRGGGARDAGTNEEAEPFRPPPPPLPPSASGPAPPRRLRPHMKEARLWGSLQGAVLCSCSLSGTTASSTVARPPLHLLPSPLEDETQSPGNPAIYKPAASMAYMVVFVMLGTPSPIQRVRIDAILRRQKDQHASVCPNYLDVDWPAMEVALGFQSERTATLTGPWDLNDDASATSGDATEAAHMGSSTPWRVPNSMSPRRAAMAAVRAPAHTPLHHLRQARRPPPSVARRSTGKRGNYARHPPAPDPVVNTVAAVFVSSGFNTRTSVRALRLRGILRAEEEGRPVWEEQRLRGAQKM